MLSRRVEYSMLQVLRVVVTVTVNFFDVMWLVLLRFEVSSQNPKYDAQRGAERGQLHQQHQQRHHQRQLLLRKALFCCIQLPNN